MKAVGTIIAVFVGHEKWSARSRIFGQPVGHEYRAVTPPYQGAYGATGSSFMLLPAVAAANTTAGRNRSAWLEAGLRSRPSNPESDVSDLGQKRSIRDGIVRDSNGLLN
jgi:hypothetical protein